MPCCVRLTAAISATCGSMSPARKPAVDDADAAFFGEHDRHRRARDRVHVGRHERALERQVLREAHPEIDGVGIAPQQDAALRRQQEIVEGATAHDLEQVHVSTRLPTADCRLPTADCRLPTADCV